MDVGHVRAFHLFHLADEFVSSRHDCLGILSMRKRDGIVKAHERGLVFWKGTVGEHGLDALQLSDAVEHGLRSIPDLGHRLSYESLDLCGLVIIACVPCNGHACEYE